MNRNTQRKIPKAGGSSTWGQIGGTLSNQTDLANSLNGKESTANKKTSLAENSDTYYPTQKAVKTAIDAKQDALGFTPENVSNKSTDITTDGDSDIKYPSAKAVKTYADSLVAGLLDYRGAYNASGNSYPATGGSGAAGAVMKGDMWIISVQGTLGGTVVHVGDSIIANVDNPGQTAANWNELDTTLTFTPENVANKVVTFSTPTDVQYPSAKLVSDQLALKSPLRPATTKTALVDADEVTGNDSAATFGQIKTTWTNVKSFLKTYFDTIYAQLAGSVTQAFTVASLELGNASDTTLTRVAAGLLAVEGEVLNGYASTATAAGTTTLTIASKTVQYFTGSSTQTIKLPTTSVIAGQQYIIVNKCTANSCILTVQSSGANEIIKIGYGCSVTFTALQATPTTAAHWSFQKLGKNILTASSYTTDTGTSLNSDYWDVFMVTAQAGALKLNNPGGSPLDGRQLIVRIKDNGTARALTYDTQFRALGNALPSTTVISKTLYLGFMFNAADTKWDLIAVAQEA